MQTKMKSDEFAHEVMWLVDGGSTAYDLERAFGASLDTIRRRIQRRAETVKKYTPVWPWQQQLLALDRRLNVLDVAARNPLAA